MPRCGEEAQAARPPCSRWNALMHSAASAHPRRAVCPSCGDALCAASRLPQAALKVVCRRRRLPQRGCCARRDALSAQQPLHGAHPPHLLLPGGVPVCEQLCRTLCAAGASQGFVGLGWARGASCHAENAGRGDADERRQHGHRAAATQAPGAPPRGGSRLDGPAPTWRLEAVSWNRACRSQRRSCRLEACCFRSAVELAASTPLQRTSKGNRGGGDQLAKPPSALAKSASREADRRDAAVMQGWMLHCCSRPLSRERERESEREKASDLESASLWPKRLVYARAFDKARNTHGALPATGEMGSSAEEAPLAANMSHRVTNETMFQGSSCGAAVSKALLAGGGGSGERACRSQLGWHPSAATVWGWRLQPLPVALPPL